MIEKDFIEVHIRKRFYRHFFIQTLFIMMLAWANSFRYLLFNPLIAGVLVSLGAAAWDYFIKIRPNLKSHRSLKQKLGDEYVAKASAQLEETSMSAMIHSNWFLSERLDLERTSNR